MGLNQSAHNWNIHKPSGYFPMVITSRDIDNTRGKLHKQSMASNDITGDCLQHYIVLNHHTLIFFHHNSKFLNFVFYSLGWKSFRRYNPNGSRMHVNLHININKVSEYITYQRYFVNILNVLSSYLHYILNYALFIFIYIIGVLTPTVIMGPVFLNVFA